jgi:hypothetical protein
MRTGYLSEDGFYFAPGAILPVLVASKCKCGCHHGALMHMFPCCVPDPPPDTPRVPAVGDQQRASMRVLYGHGTWDERVQRDWPSKEEADKMQSALAHEYAKLAEVQAMEITTLQWETRGGGVPLPVEHKEL